MNKKIMISVIISIGMIYVAILFYISSIQSLYNVEIVTEKEIYIFKETQTEDYVIPVTIYNRANRMLSSAGDVCIFMSYHLYNADGKLLVYDNIRSELNKAYFTGDVGNVDLHVSVLQAGTYKIGIDFVEEGVGWFSKKEDMQKMIEIVVEK